MEVLSSCPLPVGSLPWQPRPGAHALTVICKATFALRLGESPLADAQDGIGESDLCPFKRRADVLFLGHAHAPPGGPIHALLARLIVGALDKAIEVRADRAWAAAGLGPIAPTWPSRTAMLGRHAATWDHRAWNTRPLPEDVDGAFFNAAPPDQQLAELTGDETIVLEHLSPFYPRLETRLARVVPRATVRREDGAAQEVRLRCDTLSIDGDRAIASLVFRGVVLLSHPAEPGVVTFTAEGTAVSPKPEGADVPADLQDLIGDATGTAVISPSELLGAVKPALPFVAGAPAPEVEHPAEAGLEDVQSLIGDATGTAVISPSELLGAVKPALPFVADAPAPEVERSAKAWYEAPAFSDSTGTVTLQVPPIRESLPFQPAPPEEDLEEPPTPRGSWRAEPEIASEPAPEPSQAHAELHEPEAEARVPFDVPPPPMLGPVPIPAAPPPTESAASEPRASVPAAPAAPVVKNEAPALPEPTPVELSLEQVATIAAEIAEGRQERAKVLDAHGLGERAFRENERRWMEAIEDEGARGVHALRATYDGAYVARVEKFRGPITLEEYARIVAALDRGRTDGALDALKIQRPALMPIVRLWTRKVARDMRLADEATEALRAARRA